MTARLRRLAQYLRDRLDADRFAPDGWDTDEGRSILADAKSARHAAFADPDATERIWLPDYDYTPRHAAPESTEE